MKSAGTNEVKLRILSEMVESGSSYLWQILSILFSVSASIAETLPGGSRKCR
jgi:hypothetical protein